MTEEARGSHAPFVRTVKVGQVWKDNYDYRTEYVRHVKIVAIASNRETVKIISCSPDGMGIAVKSRVTETKTSRFNGGKSGFTFVKEAS